MEMVFSPEQFPPELESRIRQAAYDWVIVPMANHHMEGYANALGVARKLERFHLLGVFADGSSKN